MSKETSKNNLQKNEKPALRPSSEKSFLDHRYAEAAGLLAIILLGFIIYSGSFGCSFHFDDRHNILENIDVRDLHSLGSWLKSGTNRPLAMYTFSLNYQWSKFDVRSWHYVNLAIHLINACLVWWLTGLIWSTPVMRAGPSAKYRREIAFFTALLFVCHPLATQSVTYIVQRMTSMAALFYMLSVALYIRGRLEQTFAKYLLLSGAVISGMLAFMTKENTYSLPLAVALAEICFMKDRKITFDIRDSRLLVVIASLLVFLVAVQLKGTSGIFNPVRAGHGQNYTVTPFNYLMTQFSVIPKYVQLLFIPASQNLDYDWPLAKSFFEARTFFGFLALAALLASAVYMFNRERILSFGILWFFITLSVESGVIPIEDLINEHRTYLPSYGFFVFAVYRIFMWLRQKYRWGPAFLFLLASGIFSVMTYQRNKVWKDGFSLWSDVMKKSPGKVRPLNVLGDYYYNDGQTDKAIALYSKAISMNPDYPIILNNRATAYVKLKEYGKALEDYDRGIALSKNYYKGYSNRASIHLYLGNYDKAIADFNAALRDEKIGLQDAGVRLGLGNAYFNLGKWDEAIIEYDKVLERDSRNEEALLNRANAQFSLQKTDKALEDYTACLEINPKNKSALFFRGRTYGNQNKWELSVADYSRAIEIDPGYTSAYINRGAAFTNLGRWDKAVQDYDKALELDPKNGIALSNRRIALGKMKG